MSGRRTGPVPEVADPRETPETPGTPFTLRSLQEMLGISRSTITQLIAAGFVKPHRGERGEYRFSFQDVVLMRTAYGLRAAKIPPRKIVGALQRVRQALPPEVPLTGLRISAVGRDVTVRDGAAHWEVDSGQLLMDFHVEPVGRTLAFVPSSPKETAPAPDDPAQWFERGEHLEADDPLAAEAAYRHVLHLDPGHADAYLNLGALLCETGRCAEAVALYDEAVGRLEAEPLLHFNRAIALEDLGREPEAEHSYRRCLALMPDFADAHYNLARLYEQRGDQRAALRHYNAYRRHAGGGR